MVQDDPKLPDDGRETPKLNRVVGSLILGCEIISLLDGNQPSGQKTPPVV